MNKTLCLTATLLAFSLVSLSGQPAAQPPASRTETGDFNQRLSKIIAAANPGAVAAPELTKFDLDFPGGKPAQLVDAIEKAMGKPVNVIINREDEEVEIPALKMNNVVLPQLFTALEKTSQKTVAVSNPSRGYGGYTEFVCDYGFQTSDSPVSDTSVWCFHVEKPSLPALVPTQKACQYYALSPYLNRGFTVDDITTAIQTGWKLAGETSPPELNYHKETGLLIAYGEPEQLATIQNVLGTLPSSKMTGAELDELKTNVRDLRQDVRDLKAQIQDLKQNPAPQGTKPEEKSGK